MKLPLLFVAAVWIVWNGSAFGQAIIENDNLTFGASSGKIVFTVYQDAQATDFTEVRFNFSGSAISLDLINLDEGSDWYVVQPGDVFSPTTIASGEFAPIVTFGPMSHPPVPVGPGDFYLGVSTGQGFDIPEDRTVFGWVLLRQTPGSPILMMVQNVMSYDSAGIIIGTTTLVPEPATFTLVACGLMIPLLSRRLRRPQVRDCDGR